MLLDQESVKTPIAGSIVAMVTPMAADGSLDEPGFDRLLEWHIAEGTDAIVIAGTTGESATLSHAEHCALVARAVEKAAGCIPVIAGTGSNNTAEALQLTRSAADCGASAALLVTPYYNKPSRQGLYRHYAVIAETIDIPQILYNVPGRTACDLELETVLRLAEFDNIVAIKDATGDPERGRELVEACDVAEIAVYSGEDAVTLPLMRAGARGTISVTANVAPEKMAKLCELALAGDFARAAAVNDELMPLHRDLFVEGNPAPVKWALRRMGRIASGIRLPLVELHPQFHRQLEQALIHGGVNIENPAPEND